MTDFRIPEPPLEKSFTAGELSARLVESTTSLLIDFEKSTAPAFVLPNMYAGHTVLEDAKADLLYVLGLLLELGTDEVAGHNLRESMERILASLEPKRVEGFYSYRTGESVLRLGGLEAIPKALRQPVLEAVDSPQILSMLDDPDKIPPNFAIVATRCVRALAALDPERTPTDLGALLDRVRSMFRSTSTGWINDGMSDWVHYDIYTPDMYLFAEPLIDELGDDWQNGLATVLDDLDQIAQPGGSIVWGRSIGALGMAITIELAATSVGRNVGSTQDRWLTRASETFGDLLAWFPNGVIAAHQRRAAMFYRGPARRLQMTLDIYGKILLAAIELRRRPDVRSADPGAAWQPAERFIHFAGPGELANATLWSFRSKALSFALPTLFGFSADYGPSPRGSGLIEQPTSGHPVMLPVINPIPKPDISGSNDKPLIPAGLPTSVEHTPGTLTVVHQGWAEAGSSDITVDGTRTCTYRVEGRSLQVEELLEFNDLAALPGPLSITIAESEARPVDVSVEGAPVQTIDTSGLSDWRSFWGELPRVHQIEIEPADRIAVRWRVTPRLRVASTIHGHPYDELLYRPLAGRVVTGPMPTPDHDLVRHLRDVDILHMAWPEWWTGTDPSRTAAVLDQIRACGTAVVWTQHNLLPHFFKNDDAAASYQLWADAADAVIHHTEVGRDLALATYDYGADCTHHVIHHGHWGDRYAPHLATDRGSIERTEGWDSCPLRLGVVGTPRVEKDLQLVVDAVAASSRNDIQLVIRVDDSVELPDDPRIIAEQGHTDDNTYLRRMVAFDALVLPFTKPGMLTTGTAFDCIGAGVPAITSEWDFFDETFQGADIRFDNTATGLTNVLDALTADDIATAAAATAALQPAFEWTSIAEQTLSVLEEVADRK